MNARLITTSYNGTAMNKHPAYNEMKCSNKCSLDTCSNIASALKIDLSGCDLYAIPSELRSATSVKVIDLSDNHIKQIQNLDNASNLEYLNLGVNDIEEISGLSQLHKLKTLRLHDNNIKKVSGLEDLKNLERLDLRYNQIEWIEGFDALDNAKKIALDGNPLQSAQERRIVDIGVEIGDVGMRLREEEIARDVVNYSAGKRMETMLENVVEGLRRSIIKEFNSIM